MNHFLTTELLKISQFRKVNIYTICLSNIIFFKIVYIEKCIHYIFASNKNFSSPLYIYISLSLCFTLLFPILPSILTLIYVFIFNWESVKKKPQNMVRLRWLRNTNIYTSSCLIKIVPICWQVKTEWIHHDNNNNNLMRNIKLVKLHSEIFHNFDIRSSIYMSIFDLP